MFSIPGAAFCCPGSGKHDIKGSGTEFVVINFEDDVIGNVNWEEHDFPIIFVEDMQDRQYHRIERFRKLLEKPHRCEWTNANAVSFCRWSEEEHVYYSRDPLMFTQRMFQRAYDMIKLAGLLSQPTSIKVPNRDVVSMVTLAYMSEQVYYTVDGEPLKSSRTQLDHQEVLNGWTVGEITKPPGISESSVLAWVMFEHVASKRKVIAFRGCDSVQDWIAQDVPNHLVQADASSVLKVIG